MSRLFQSKFCKKGNWYEDQDLAAPEYATIVNKKKADVLFGCGGGTGSIAIKNS